MAAVLDYQWAQELLTLPMYLRTVDDDALWMEYRLNERNNNNAQQEQQQGTGTGSDVDGGVSDNLSSNGGGIRRRLSRLRLRRLREEQKEIEDETRFEARREAKRIARKVAMKVEKRALRIGDDDAHKKGISLVAKVDHHTESRLHEQINEEKATEEARRALARAAKAAKRKERISSSSLISQLNLQHQQHQQRNLQTPEELYYDLCWIDLPDDIRQAYEILGYDEAIWEGEGEAYTEMIDWPDLTEEQREAALLIGYSEEDWCMTIAPTPSSAMADDNVAIVATTPSPTRLPTLKPVTTSPTRKPTGRPTANPTNQPTSKPVTPSPTKTSIQYWNELPSGYQEIYETIGYTQSSWNNGNKVDADYKTWDELTFGERISVSILGYDSITWNNTPSGSHFTNQPLAGTFEYWNELSPGFQETYMTLGYTQKSWDSGQKVNVDFKSWKEMDFGERLGVYSLGYTQESWDGTVGGDHFGNQPLPGMVSSVAVVGGNGDNANVSNTPGPTREVSWAQPCFLWLLSSFKFV